MPAPEMLDEAITNLERELHRGALEEPRKVELLRLLTALRAEVSGLPLTYQAHARRISGLAARSAQEAGAANGGSDAGRTAGKSAQDPALELSLRGLAATVEEVELEHPRLAEIANRLCALLSNLGI